jgi:hypothetical protein
VTAFFIPGVEDHPRSAQDAYSQMRKRVEQKMGRPPRQRRIVELWTRRGNVDCITTVGQPDPICGDIVVAIFDMGSHQPFVVCHRRGDEMRDVSWEVLDANAYAVSEFDP